MTERFPLHGARITIDGDKAKFSLKTEVPALPETNRPGYGLDRNLCFTMARNTFAGTVAYACGMSMERMSRLMGDNVDSVFEQKKRLVSKRNLRSLPGSSKIFDRFSCCRLFTAAGKIS